MTELESKQSSPMPTLVMLAAPFGFGMGSCYR